MGFEVHHGGSSLNNVANLHVSITIRNTTWFEVLLPDAAHKQSLVRDITPDERGMVHASEGLGLGCGIDMELIARKRIAVLK